MKTRHYTQNIFYDIKCVIYDIKCVIYDIKSVIELQNNYVEVPVMMYLQ